MPVINVDIEINIEVETEEIANIVLNALDPDNLATPPMTFSSEITERSILFTLKKVERIETALITLTDLLSAIQTISDILRLKGIKKLS